MIHEAGGGILFLAMRAPLAIAILLAASACGDDGSTTNTTATWQLLASDQPSSLLAVWAPSTDNAWVVGGREGIGGEPPVWHFDGTAWTKLSTGMTSVDLWQVFGFEGGPVFMAGSNGTILRFEDGTFTKLTTPGANVIFGLWGASPTDMWAVGGAANGGNAFIWHYAGQQFDEVDGIPAELTGNVWKVTGRAANDVYMSGSQGHVLHWDGNALSSETIGTLPESEELFSLGCGATHCVVAGSNGTNGVLFDDDGSGWTSRVPTEDGPQWRGVTPVADEPYVVGQFGTVLHYDDGAFVVDPHGLTTKTLHAAWSNDAGDLFTVGGDFQRVPTEAGVLLYKGAEALPSLP
jgi:hypothetical protein